MDLIKGCEFCERFPTVTVPHVHETDNFFVQADRSPLVIGHVMIISKSHFGCAGEVPDELRSELLELIHFVTERVRSIYGTASMYEHGRAGHCVPMNNGQGMCEHFHLHVLPIDITTDPDFEKENIDVWGRREPKTFGDVFTFFDRHGSYLYLCDNRNNGRCFSVDHEALPPHYLRSFISKNHLAHDRGDWLNSQNTDEQWATYNNWKK
jgi:diadenosine tetraphosphate (Ap4A) HIT family hydrolase